VESCASFHSAGGSEKIAAGPPLDAVHGDRGEVAAVVIRGGHGAGPAGFVTLPRFG